MTHRILVGIEQPSEAARLVDEVRRLARALGSEIVLLHLAEPDPTFMPFDADTDAQRDQRAHWERADHRHLHELAETLRDEGFAARALQYRGPPADALAERAERLEADLVAVGSHRRGPMMRALLGSVSHRLIDQAPCPVLVVPEGLPDLTGDAGDASDAG